MTDATLLDVLGLLIDIEDGPASDTGTFAFEDGAVFLQDGRICWAAAFGMAHRLTDLLQECAPPGVDLNALYRQCRDRDQPLGETLVATGIVSSDDLARALRRHTAESLIEIAKHGGTGLWSARNRSYSPRYTFAPADLYEEVVKIVLGDVHAEATESLVPLSGQTRPRAAFLLEAGMAVPVAAAGIPLAEVWTLGTWAASLRDAARELAVAAGFALGTTATNQTTFVWWQDNLMFAVIGEDRAAAGEMTASHLRRGWS